MKDIIKHTAEWLLLGIITVLLCYAAYQAYTLKDKVEFITKTDTVTLTDTITNWQCDTMYFNRYDTINLTDVVIINDTVNDTTYIQLPLYTYIFDTTITDTNYTSDFKAVVSGFAVSLDTLSIHTKILQEKAILTPKQRRWGLGVGLMYGTGGFGIGAGVMYQLF